jgi:hypothetical protein
MRREVLKSYCINTDDTPVPVQDKAKTHRADCWVYIGDADHPFTVYDFTWTRCRAGPERFLGGYEGFLQADAYAGYDRLFTGGKITEVGCWAHARRKFFEAKTTAPAPANDVLLRIQSLYNIERQAKERMEKHADDPDLALAERLALRQEKTVAKLGALHDWLQDQQPRQLPKSPIGQAISYALGNWDALIRYADNPRLEIDNTVASYCTSFAGFVP